VFGHAFFPARYFGPHFFGPRAVDTVVTRFAPDAILASTNLTGAVAAVQDDPDAPDGSWLTATALGGDTDVRFSFPTAETDLLGPQTIYVWLRTTAIPTRPVRVELWEAGAKRTSETTVTPTSTTGEMVPLTFDSSELSDPSGAGVEIRIRTNF
jgi:hypothetical protein